ncbi:ricin-type beta-trefoil lectin domain protein [Streptomyces sp. NPDC088354]|uniref:ricin-type beta-trefoil lectin domain protein n=1 Tax=Streptomyces sp. NPDC088354 TaxID=3365856 RepID=UPI0038209F54
MPSPSEPRHPEVLEGAPERFSEHFARRPALPRRGLLPGKRVWAATATAAAVVGCAVLVVPLLAQIDVFPEHGADGGPVAAAPAASVSAGTPGEAGSDPSASTGSPTVGTHTDSQNSGPRGLVSGTGGGTGGVTGGGAGTVLTGGGNGTVHSGGSGGIAAAGGGSTTGGGGSTTTGTTGTGGTGSSGSGTNGSGTTGSGSGSGSGTSGSATKPTPKPTKTQQTVTVPGVRIRSSASGRCIDITNASDGIGRDGSRLRIWDCGGAASQKWDFRSDGSVHSLGLCMDLAWASTANGTAVQLAKCNGGWAQQFVLNSAGDLVNPHADKCVDVVDKATGNGTTLQLWTCYGTSNQKWYRN